MKAIYHTGEIAVQKRVGVTKMAERVGNGIHDTIPDWGQEFLESQSLAVISSIGTDGYVWASVLSGEPGFIVALDDKTVRIEAHPHPADPLTANLQNHTENPFARRPIGMIAIELETRQRMRLNGEAEVSPDGSLLVYAQEVYANCPKFIQSREIRQVEETEQSTADVQKGKILGAGQQTWIATADTFFIASAGPNGRADASHRGGNPGFVQVINSDTLAFPDYSGNTMFNTLGNISVNPNAGLLFLNFETGDTLQLSGNARIDWDSARAAQFPGAERVVEFHIEQVIQIAHANPLRFRFLQYSRFNPN